MCHIYPENLFLYACVPRGFRTDPAIETGNKATEKERKKQACKTNVIHRQYNHKFIECNYALEKEIVIK